MPKDKSLISWGSKGMNKRKAKNRNSKYKKIPRIIEWFISEKSNTKSYFTIGKQTVHNSYNKAVRQQAKKQLQILFL